MFWRGQCTALPSHSDIDNHYDATASTTMQEASSTSKLSRSIQRTIARISDRTFNKGSQEQPTAVSYAFIGSIVHLKAI